MFIVSVGTFIPTGFINDLVLVFLLLHFFFFFFCRFYCFIFYVCFFWCEVRLIWFCFVLWHIIHCRLFNAKSSLYIYIKYRGFGLVGFYGISTIVGYLMPNRLYTYISNKYDLVWFGWLLWHINHSCLSNAKSSLYIYIK